MTKFLLLPLGFLLYGSLKFLFVLKTPSLVVTTCPACTLPAGVTSQIGGCPCAHSGLCHPPCFPCYWDPCGVTHLGGPPNQPPSLRLESHLSVVLGAPPSPELGILLVRWKLHPRTQPPAEASASPHLPSGTCFPVCSSGQRQPPAQGTVAGEIHAELLKGPGISKCSVKVTEVLGMGARGPCFADEDTEAEQWERTFQVTQGVSGEAGTHPAGRALTQEWGEART